MHKGFSTIAAAAMVMATACAVDGTRGGEESIAAVEQGLESCAGILSWRGGDWTFTIQAGEVIEHQGNAYRANVDIGYPSVECAPDAPAQWCSNWFTDLGPCDSAAPNTGSESLPVEASNTSIPLACFSNQRLDMMCAELAVAMAREIGELNPLRDLTVSGNRVALSQEGASRCGGGCESTLAILSLQEDWVNQMLDETIFNALAFRSNLIAQYYEQVNYEQDLSLNHPDWLPSPHALSLTGKSAAYCGTNYAFQVSWQCSGKRCVKDASTIENRMKFFRPNNTVIDFIASEDQISIDPTGTMNGDGESSSGSCREACLSLKAGQEGDCCICNGARGTFVPGSNPRVLVCAT